MYDIKVNGKVYKTSVADLYSFHVQLDHRKTIPLIEEIEKLLAGVNCYVNRYRLFYLKKGAKTKSCAANAPNKKTIYSLISELDSFTLTFDAGWRLGHYDLFTEKYPFYIEFSSSSWSSKNLQVNIGIDEKVVNDANINTAALFLQLGDLILSAADELVYAYGFRLDKRFFPQSFLNGGQYNFANEALTPTKKTVEEMAFDKLVSNHFHFDTVIWRICGLNIINQRHIKNEKKLLDILKETDCEFFQISGKHLFFSLPAYSKVTLGYENTALCNRLLDQLHHTVTPATPNNDVSSIIERLKKVNKKQAR